MSFLRYEKYKNSWVEWLDDVPGHWSTIRMKWLAKIKNGRDYKDVESESGLYPVFGSGGEFARATTYLHNGESVLLGRKGTIDRPLYINGPFWTVDTMFYTLPEPDACGRYLYYCSLTIHFDLYSTNTALPSMTQADLANIFFAVPQYEEQVTIAAFLDRETAKIDALVEEQRRLIELLKEKRQAVISHAVTKGLNPDAPMKDSGVDWLGEIPSNWKLGRISHLVSTRKGIAFQAEHFTDDGVAVVKASDVKNLTVRPSSTYLPQRFLEQYPQAILRREEIILSTVGSTPDVKNSAVGQLGLLPEELSGSLLNQNTVVFTPSSRSLINSFLFLVLQTTGYRDHLDLHAHGTANQASLNVSDMLDFSVSLPSPTEQEAIATFIQEQDSKMQALKAEARRAIDLLQERRSALISAAVTGKIDVRGLVKEVVA